MTVQDVLVVALLLWSGLLTVGVFVNLLDPRKPKSHTQPCGEGVPQTSGPRLIANFVRDRFGNIVKREKRTARRGDDFAAWEHEQEERDGAR